MKHLAALFEYISKRSKLRILLAVSCGVFMAVLDYLTITSIGPVVDYLLNSKNLVDSMIYVGFVEIFEVASEQEIKLAYLIVFALLVSFSLLVRLMLNYQVAHASQMSGYDFAKKISKSQLSIGQSNNTPDSEKLALVSSKIMILINQGFGPFIQSVTAFPIIVIYTIIFSTIFGIESLGFIALLLVSFYALITLTGSRLTDYGSSIKNGLNEIYRIVTDAYACFREVQVYSLSSKIFDQFGRNDQNVRKSQAKSQFLITFPRYLIESVGLMLLVVFTYVYSSNYSYLGEIVLITVTGLLAIQKILPIFQQFFNSISMLRVSSAVTKEILRELELANNHEIKESYDKEIAIDRIVYSSVSLSRDKEKIKRSEFDLIIHSGDKIVITGESGSGKSTFLDSIFGFYSPICERIKAYDKRDSIIYII